MPPFALPVPSKLLILEMFSPPPLEIMPMIPKIIILTNVELFLDFQCPVWIKAAGDPKSKGQHQHFGFESESLFHKTEVSNVTLLVENLSLVASL